MRVLILGSFSNASTSIARALSHRGAIVDAASCRPGRRRRYADRFQSKYVDRHLILPCPLSESYLFREALLELLEEYGDYDVLLPVPYEACLAIAELQAELPSSVKAAGSPKALLEMLHDKESLYRAAESLGIKTPRRYAYTDGEDLRGQVDRFPVILKARQGEGARGMHFARNRDELEHAFRAMEEMRSDARRVEDYSHPIVEDYVPGVVHDVGFLFCEGRCRLAVTQRRTLMYPFRAGRAVEVVITREPDLIEQGRALLEHLGWHGACQVEFKRDARDGSPRLLEINPRMWGSIGAALAAGANFPAKWCEMAVRGDTDLQTDYQVGLRYRIVLPLSIYAICQPRGPKWKRLRETLRVCHPTVRSEIRWSDPVPHLRMLAETVLELARNREEVLFPDPLADLGDHASP